MICSKFITFVVTKTTNLEAKLRDVRCDLLKIHYLCGDKDNLPTFLLFCSYVVICSKFITFVVTKTTKEKYNNLEGCCDLLKIHYLCGDKDN